MAQSDGFTLNIVFSGLAPQGTLSLAPSAADWFAPAPQPVLLAEPAWPGRDISGDTALEVLVVYGDDPTPGVTDLDGSDPLGQSLDLVLAELSDDGLAALLEGDPLEATPLAGPAPETDTFVLTSLDIDALLMPPAPAEATVSELFQAPSGPVGMPEGAHVGPVTIEIEDDGGLASTHIIA